MKKMNIVKALAISLLANSAVVAAEVPVPTVGYQSVALQVSGTVCNAANTVTTAALNVASSAAHYVVGHARKHPVVTDVVAAAVVVYAAYAVAKKLAKNSEEVEEDSEVI